MRITTTRVRIETILHSLFFVIYLLSNAFAYGFQYSEWNLASYNGAYATINNGLIYISNGGSEY